MKKSRPKWCEHKDCIPKGQMGVGSICGGKLAKPEEHCGANNTHRFCLKQCDGEAYDFQANQGDCFVLSLFFKAFLEEIIKDNRSIKNKRKEKP